MDKKILAVYYTQSGQLKEILDYFLIPFQESGASIEILNIEPENDFEFPWTSKRFFDVMPESVTVTPAALKPFSLKSTKYDLIIFAYQPWFLSPSIPANSILQHPGFVEVTKGTPVVTLIGARNMWLNSQEKIKKLLHSIKCPIVGNVALVDQNSNLQSAVSILYWMFSGKKERWLGIFPKPGVADENIRGAQKYGQLAQQCLENGDLGSLQAQLVEMNAVEVKSNLMFIEGRAGKLFAIWANFILKRKNRTFWLKVFKYYLIIALFIIAPIVLLINMVFFKPFVRGSIKRKKKYYLGLN